MAKIVEIHGRFPNLASERPSPVRKPGFEDSIASQGPADPSPLMIAMRNVAAIWLVALIAYAVIASLV